MSELCGILHFGFQAHAALLERAAGLREEVLAVKSEKKLECVIVIQSCFVVHT